jgi:hypothetical protein
VQVLPDLNEGRWEYNYTGQVPDGMHKGVDAYAYSYSVVKDEGNGETTASYTFYFSTVRFLATNTRLGRVGGLLEGSVNFILRRIGCTIDDHRKLRSAGQRLPSS